MPDGWASKESNGSDYFEALDGTKGLYVKAIELSDPKETARELADYIQDVHFRAFADLDESAWAVVDQLAVDVHQFCRSRLDLYDSEANYRVLSLVLCDASKAIQVSVHDYFCENYPASRGDFSDLEKSVCSVSAGV